MTEFDPEARRAELRAHRDTRSTPGVGSAAFPRRRRHAALASRVLASGLAAGTAVGLIGVMADADRAPASASPTVPIPATTVARFTRGPHPREHHCRPATTAVPTVSHQRRTRRPRWSRTRTHSARSPGASRHFTDSSACDRRPAPPVTARRRPHLPRRRLLSTGASRADAGRRARRTVLCDGHDGAHPTVGGRSTVAQQAQLRLAALESRWSRFHGSDERANRSAGHWVPVASETILLLQRSMDGWPPTAVRLHRRRR